jgi:hypothetical protein
MNRAYYIILVSTLSNFLFNTLVYSQDSWISNTGEVLFSDSNYSSVQYYDRGMLLTSVKYTSEWLTSQNGTSAFIVKQTKSEKFDFQVDGSYVTITVDMFQREADSVFLYKTFSIKEDNLEFIRANKFVYKTTTSGRGGDYMVYRLVDLEDNEPFSVFNHINNCKTLWSTRNGYRWISIYSTSSTGFSDWNIPVKNYIDVNGVRYSRIWSIVYSNEDEIFDIVDVYKKYGYRNKGYALERFSIHGDSIQTGSRYPNLYVLFEEEGEFQDLTLEIELRSHILKMPIDYQEIQFEQIKLENLLFKRRVDI